MGWNSTNVAEIDLVTSSLSFRESKRGFAIYVNHVPSRRLKRLYLEIVGGDSNSASQQAVAQDCVRYLAKVLDCAPSWEGRTEDELFEAVKLHFARQYGGGVTWRTSRDGKVHLRCDHETSCSTVNTVIDRLNLAFSVAVTQGWLAGNPMTRLCGPTRPNRSRELDGSDASFKTGPLPKRKPHLYQVVQGGKYATRRLIDNDEFPHQLRQAADQAQWNLRDHCALELLLCGGPRAGEVIHLTCAGLNELEQANACDLRNKGRGSALYKRIFLSEDARNRLTRYFLFERPEFDDLDEDFKRWLKSEGRSATIPLYLSFLDHEGIARHDVRVFLSEKGRPYETKSFERHALYELRHLEHGLAVSAHHIRYWYVNQFLSQLTSDRSLSIDMIIRRADDFVRQMGWSHYDSMRPYDIRGTVIGYMDDYSGKSRRRKNRRPINHEIPQFNEEADDEEAEYLRAKALGLVPD